MALWLGLLTLDIFPICNEMFLIKLLLFVVSATYSPKTQNITLIKTLFNTYSAITCLTSDISDPCQPLGIQWQKRNSLPWGTLQMLRRDRPVSSLLNRKDLELRLNCWDKNCFLKEMASMLTSQRRVETYQVEGMGYSGGLWAQSRTENKRECVTMFKRDEKI